MPKNSPNILQRITNDSICFNGLYIPTASIESVVANYTMQLVAVNDDETYPISLVGSCLGVKYQGEYFVLCTRHQLKTTDEKRIALLSNDGEMAITSSGIRQYKQGLFENEVHDLAAFKFTEPISDHPNFANTFYEFKSAPPDVLSDRIVCLVASGYPFSDQNYDLEDNRKLDKRKRIILCELNNEQQLNDDSLLCASPIQTLEFNPDGMSGGGVFVIQFVDGKAQAFLAGIITRANSKIIHFIKSGYVLKFLQSMLEKQQNR